MKLAVQHLDQQLRKNRPHSARVAYEDIRPQQHHRPDGIGRKRFTNPGRMTADEVELQLASLVRRDAHVGEFPKAGVDAVDRLAARYGRFDRPARLLYGCERLGIERHGSTVACHGHDIRDSEGMAIQRDGFCHGNQS